ncbi:autotransporter-associated N-terminal domain-containing protein [Leptotrichia sp. oral taxon 221]|uniref:autotransporter-associated N-terminal domain-containing protein n=2 Tax=unclassified Leptotrichia TaxID=2633022 RepID=UPI001B8BFAD8|nr:autotransporter-associated N-terminal domain-containing protein [Leptotrichia sp. oral taxon 221]QUB97535.1 autotransporter-associated N-terminal domain-containing protein [Leptotrichia sp. oral taxon 221]
MRYYDDSLRKLAKDLKAFAKRCKDFKYTEKALFVFLLCGIAGFADVATTTDQAIQNKRQEISTSIGDIRQEFKKVKTENNKLVKNYNLELIQLMEQGDHVVKSPWSSWQYGMNYFYNDWTGTYKGRGDKTPNVKYKRNSEDKFGTYTGGKYGSTTLNKKVIEPISAVPVDAAVKPKIPTIKTVDSAEAPTIVTPTLNIQVSAVNPSETTVPSITPPSVTIPIVSMDSVKGFTLVFPSSGDNGTHGTRKYYTDGSDGTSVNLSTNTNSNAPFIHPGTPNYISYYQFAGNQDGTGVPIRSTSDVTITLNGNATANNTYGSNQFYGGGSRFAYVDDVRRALSVTNVKFTLENKGNIKLIGPAIAGIVNEETSYTDGNITTNIKNLGSISDESENLSGVFNGTRRLNVDGTSTEPLQVTARNGKVGYKVGITQTTEETVDHHTGTYYELHNGQTTATSSSFFNDFDAKVNGAIANRTTTAGNVSISTIEKDTSIGGNNFSQDGVIHFSGDYSTGIQIASVQRSGTGESLLRADNRQTGYMQLDGAYSYGMKLSGQKLYVDNNDDYGDSSAVSYIANNGLILISGSYDTDKKGSSAGMAKLSEAKWNSKNTIFNNGRIYVAGNNNSGILLESIYKDTVTNNGDITIDRAYNLFDKRDRSYANAYATSNAGIRIQSFKTADLATGDLVGINNRTINLNNGSGNVGIYAYDVANTNDIVGINGYQILGENASGGTINVGGTNVGMMAEDKSGTVTNYKTIIRNNGKINVNGTNSVGMYTADKDSYAEQLNGAVITAKSKNVGVVNNGKFNFATGGIINADGESSVGVYSANGTDSTTTLSGTLNVLNGGVGLYANEGSTQKLIGLTANVSGTASAGSILFYNLPKTGTNKGFFDLSDTNPGTATIGANSFAFYTTNNIFALGSNAFATFLNDWKGTTTGTGLDLTMKTGSSLLLTDVSTATGTGRTIKFTNITPPIAPGTSTLKNAQSTPETVATLNSASGDYFYVTLKGADVKIDENIDLSVGTNKLNKVSIYDSDITVENGKTIQDGATPSVVNSTNLVRQKYILGVNNGRTLTNNGTITLNSTSPDELKVLVAMGKNTAGTTVSKAINDGTITSKIKKGIAIYASDGAEGTNKSNKSITMDGDGAFGMVGSNANTTNEGNITVNGTSATGMYSTEPSTVTNPTKTAINRGIITTTGDKNIGMVAKNSKITNDTNGTIKLNNSTENVGMYSEEGTKGTITNNGKIEGIDKTIGIYGNTKTVLGTASSITVGDSGVGVYSSTGDITVNSGAKIKLLKGGTGTTPADGATGVFVENKGSAGSVNVDVYNLIEGPLGKKSYGYYFKNVHSLTYTNTNGSSPITLDDGAIFIYSDATSPVGVNGIYNKQDLTSIGNGVIGIYQKGGTITNDGKLLFNTGTKNTGIYTTSGLATNNAVGTIEVGATNFGMVTKTGKLVNDGTIKITASKGTGIYSENATVDSVKNKGLITGAGITDVVGIYGKGISNEANGTIVMGDDSIGIYSNEGHVGNYGNLTVGSNKSIGILTVGTGQTVSFDGNITIGNDSFGLVNQGSGNQIDSNASNTTLGTDAVFIYQNDNTGEVKNYTPLTSAGDRNYGLYGNGTLINDGVINFSTGNGNVGIYSTGGIAKNNNLIKVGPSNTATKEYGVGMATGYYDDNPASPTYGQTSNQGTIENYGTIEVSQPNSIGMYAVGTGSKAVNYNTIDLSGDNTIGMYIDRGATGINWGTIKTTVNGLKSVKGIYVANGSYVKNYGTIAISATDLKSAGIWTDSSSYPNVEDTATGLNPLPGGTNQTGTSTPALKVVTPDDMKEMGGTTIKVPPRMTPATVTDAQGNVIPIIKVDTDIPTAAPTTAIVTAPSGITSINLATSNFLNFPSASEASSLGMYVDTSGVNYTNPIQGLSNLTGLTDINLFFGTEASRYTTARAIEVGDNILKPYNDALSGVVTAGTTLNVTAASLTWMAQPTKNAATGLLDKVYLVKIPYTMFANKNDTQTFNFLTGLEQKYGQEGLGTREKAAFDKISNLSGGEGHILAQAFDEMKGHQYSNIQQRTKETGDILSQEFNYLQDEWRNPTKDNNKIKMFGHRGEYNTDTAGVVDYTDNAYGVAYVHENETVKLGRKSGWYAGAVTNRFEFKDLGKSKETQTMIKAGLFKTVSPYNDHNGSLTWTIAGEAFAGVNNMTRRYWIVDDTFEAKSDYTTYGVALKNEIGKDFRTSERTSIRPYGALNLEYGRYSNIKEDGPMALEVKGNDYFSVQPELGVAFNYSQPVGVKSHFKASLTAAYTNELGEVNDVRNKARLKGTTADYYELRGDKEDRKGNGKFDLNIGFDNTRFGVTVNAGYDTKGENIRGGIGFRAIY